VDYYCKLQCNECRWTKVFPHLLVVEKKWLQKLTRQN
jgi:hypothetical protein